jgi:tetratricopeptide (TPR) repeat protein
MRSLSSLAYFLGNQQRDAEAIPMFEEVLAVELRLFGPGDRRTLDTRTNMATSLMDIGEMDRAMEETRLAVEGLRIAAPGSTELAGAINRMGMIAYRKKDYTGAEPLIREAIGLQRQLKDPRLVVSLSALASILKGQQRYEEAVGYLQEAIDIRRASGTLQTDFGVLLNNLADLHGQQGKDEEAERLFLESLEFDRKNRPGNRANALNIRAYCVFLVKRNRHAEAEPLAREAYELTRPQPIAQKKSLIELYAAVLEGVGKRDEANAIRTELPPAPEPKPASAAK